MSSRWFDGASGVRIGGNVSSETVEGDYVDESHTVVTENHVGREVYHQTGALGVVNDRGRFSGTLNVGRGPYEQRNNRRKPYDRSTDRDGRNRVDAPMKTRVDAERNRHRSSTRSPSQTPSPFSSTFFSGATGVTIGGDVTSKTIRGTKYDRGRKTIHRENVGKSVYHQEGAIGVVNGRGEFSGTINCGGFGSEEPRPQRYRQPSPDSNNTSSDDEAAVDAYHHRVERHYRDQRDAVGVINDDGNFSGVLNYNSALGGNDMKDRPRESSPTSRRGSGARQATPSQNGDSPSVRVRPGVSEEEAVDEFFRLYDRPKSARSPGFCGYRH